MFRNTYDSSKIKHIQVTSLCSTIPDTGLLRAEEARQWKKVSLDTGRMWLCILVGNAEQTCRGSMRVCGARHLRPEPPLEGRSPPQARACPQSCQLCLCLCRSAGRAASVSGCLGHAGQPRVRDIARHGPSEFFQHSQLIIKDEFWYNNNINKTLLCTCCKPGTLLSVLHIGMYNLT